MHGNHPKRPNNEDGDENGESTAASLDRRLKHVSQGVYLRLSTSVEVNRRITTILQRIQTNAHPLRISKSASARCRTATAGAKTAIKIERTGGSPARLYAFAISGRLGGLAVGVVGHLTCLIAVPQIVPPFTVHCAHHVSRRISGSLGTLAEV
jgi:hypothetical protein